MARTPIKVAVSLAILLTVLLAVQPLPVPAASDLIQENLGGCEHCTGVNVPFKNPVASGDVVVLGAIEYYTLGSVGPTPNVYDSKGSTFHLAVGYPNSNTFGSYSLFIWVATLSSSGSDTVELTLPYQPPDVPGEYSVLYAYEVSGVTTSGAEVAAASGHAADNFHIAVSIGSTSFVAGAFLLGMIAVDCGTSHPLLQDPQNSGSYATYTAGPGFYMDTPFDTCLNPQLSTHGVASPTYFPATVSNPFGHGWVEVAIALNPSSSTSTAMSTATQTVHTDWAVVSVGIQPSSPTEGNAVKLEMMMTALSTTGGYPQKVAVHCIIDGSSCGSGSVTYPGPTGVSFTVSAGNPWIAILGTHTLSWQVDATNDPNPGNNAMSISFTVQSSSTSQSVSTTTTQPSTSQSSTEQVTIVQTQTVTQQPTSTTSQATSQLGILDILQQNSLLLIGALGLAVIVLAIAMMRRGKHRSPTTPS